MSNQDGDAIDAPDLGRDIAAATTEPPSDAFDDEASTPCYTAAIAARWRTRRNG
jgi:hypothetical protein